MSGARATSIFGWACLAVAFHGAPSLAQLPDENSATGDAMFKYRTAADCVRCHTERAASIDQNGIARVLMNEAAIWHAHDKHSNAYQALLEPRGVRMGKLLGRNVLDKATGCLQCHTTNVDDAQWLDPDPHRVAAGLTEGVGCEACHGASSQWYDEHMLPRWRTLTLEQKANEYGFIPLQASQARAQVCLSCHVGSVSDGRVITHEMYAAGHPLLSGFELESAIERMPPHWVDQSGEPAGDRFARTRHALTASVVGMRLAVELTPSAISNARETVWPELARLDCFGCHHNLEPDGWRQRRTPAGGAGRAEFAIGCVPLLHIAASAAGDSQREREFDAALRAIREPFRTNVFGDVEQLRAASPNVIASLKRLEAHLSNQMWDEQQVARLFDQLLNRPPNELLDYDAARQLSGAAAIMLSELRGESAGGYQPAALHEQFNLQADGHPFLEASLPGMLERRVRFRPEDFRRELRTLRAVSEH